MTTQATPTTATNASAIAHRGRFVWYDLMTNDVPGAIAFYSNVVGWGTQQWQDPAMPYTMWTVDGAPMGGIMPLPAELAEQGVPPHWMAYIGTADIAATCARAGELGGTVLVPPTEIPNVGHFAVLKDPQGAAFAVYTSATEHPVPEGMPKIGEFSWHELITTDHVAALEFYAALFGWQKTDAVDMGPMGIYQMYGLGGAPLGGMMNIPEGQHFPPNWLLYARVPDIHEAVERVKAGGGQLMNGPMEVPGGDMIAQCMDPQGGAFALHATKSA